MILSSNAELDGLPSQWCFVIGNIPLTAAADEVHKAACCESVKSSLLFSLE